MIRGFAALAVVAAPASVSTSTGAAFAPMVNLNLYNAMDSSADKVDMYSTHLGRHIISLSASSIFSLSASAMLIVRGHAYGNSDSKLTLNVRRHILSSAADAGILADADILSDRVIEFILLAWGLS